MNTMKFAGFIMTYERPEIVLETIEILFAQTLTLEKILIVDNSASFDTQKTIETLNDSRVVYHRVGYNSGPAGAAAIGLKILAAEGYEWIYWGDDDDPPLFDDTLEILMRVAQTSPKCGTVGVVGNYYNPKTGFLERVTDEELLTDGILEVDTIAGGMSKIVNGPMILKTAISTDEKLFYGSEELDFDLKVKKAGYTHLVDRAYYLKHRHYFNRMNLAPKKLKKKTDRAIVREYYSIRNNLRILYKNRNYKTILVFYSYFFLKSFASFKFGFRYGIKMFWNVLVALKDFIFGNYGKTL